MNQLDDESTYIDKQSKRSWDVGEPRVNYELKVPTRWSGYGDFDQETPITRTEDGNISIADMTLSPLELSNALNTLKDLAPYGKTGEVSFEWWMEIGPERQKIEYMVSKTGAHKKYGYARQQGGIVKAGDRAGEVILSKYSSSKESGYDRAYHFRVQDLLHAMDLLGALEEVGPVQLAPQASQASTRQEVDAPKYAIDAPINRDYLEAIWPHGVKDFVQARGHRVVPAWVILLWVVVTLCQTSGNIINLFFG
jgi:hypothetical protein